MVEKFLFLGDSITEGVGASSPEKMYVNRVEAMTGVKCLNYGVGGTRIARQKGGLAPWTIWDYDFIARSIFMPDEADFVFVFGGTNDYGHGYAPIGEIGDCTEYTYCGAVQLLINMLVNRYGKDKLCFILPIHRICEDNVRGDGWKEPRAVFSVYVELQRQILINNGILYLDLLDVLPQPTTCENVGLFSDGLHPNDAGHQLIADQVVKFLKEKKII